MSVRDNWYIGFRQTFVRSQAYVFSSLAGETSRSSRSKSCPKTVVTKKCDLFGFFVPYLRTKQKSHAACISMGQAISLYNGAREAGAAQHSFHAMERQSRELLDRVRGRSQSLPGPEVPQVEHELPDSVHNAPGGNLYDQARARASSLSMEVRNLAQRASHSFEQGNTQEAEHLLNEADARNQENRGILGWLGNNNAQHHRSRSGSLATRGARMAVHTIIPAPCRWGIYTCGHCCCCCCWPQRVDDLL